MDVVNFPNCSDKQEATTFAGVMGIGGWIKKNGENIVKIMKEVQLVCLTNRPLEIYNSLLFKLSLELDIFLRIVSGTK